MNAQTQVEVPATAVVWNRAGAGTYVWDRPDGEITSFLENGLVVELLENWAVHGGVPFGEMQHDGQSGWLDMRHVHRLVLPASGFNRVSSTAGANLYAQPGGAVLTWLSPGTPLIETGNTAGVPSAEWVAVALLVGGQSGWVNHNALDNPGR